MFVETKAPDRTSQRFDASFAFCVVQEVKKGRQEREREEMITSMVSDPLRGSGIMQGRPDMHS